MACLPPDYPLLFGNNGSWGKSLKLEERAIKLKIDGRMQFMGWPDRLTMKIQFNGLDTSKMNIFASERWLGRLAVETDYFDDKILFESEAFKPFHLQIYAKKLVTEVIIEAPLEIHKPYSDLTRDEFLSYLDSFNARIRIVNVFSEPKIIEVKPDRKLLLKKMGKWVPALQSEKQELK
jgi:AAA+ superfamily predicted ATPase